MVFLRKFLRIPIYPAHVLLVLIFFLTHGFAEHSDLLNVAALIPLFFYMLLLSVLVYLVSYRMLRDRHKAGLYTTMILVVLLFYGAIENSFGLIPGLIGIAKLRYVLPILLAALIFCYTMIRRAKEVPVRVTRFLNLLFIIYIGIDCFTIFFHANSAKDAKLSRSSIDAALKPCDTCHKPDIYFVVLDEYFGTQGLEEYYGYDNSWFEAELAREKFHVVRNAVSNYQFTNLSIASITNMQLFDSSKRKRFSDDFNGLKNSMKEIRENVVCKYLESQNYSINNYSIFYLGNKPPLYYNSFISTENVIITDKTLFHRISKSFLRFFATKTEVPWIEDRLFNDIDKSNKKIISGTVRHSQEKNTRPDFYYLHLTMPHSPFLYDSLGNRMKVLYDSSNFEKIDSAYLQYLVYTNYRMLEFVKELKRTTDGRAIIILVGDHGYRLASRKGKRDLRYKVLHAVYKPDQSYGGWYDGMSNVNLFRALFNSQFAQTLPMIRDTLLD